MNHVQIWNAIDSFAKDRGYSVSGLAKASGLDPTTFNKSKRLSVYGQERWPSTNSISKILAATNTSFADFVKYVE
ncbi:MAG: hypothetical protein MJ156_01620 [Alphaproteobacteria bacterium]|nr:hypothetical protein [Alphaproteobacteria bacterium]